MRKPLILLFATLVVLTVLSCKSNKDLANSGQHSKTSDPITIDPNCAPATFVFEHLKDKDLKGLRGKEYRKQDWIFKDIYHYSYDPVPQAVFPNSKSSSIWNFPGGIGWQYEVQFDSSKDLEQLIRSVSNCLNLNPYYKEDKKFKGRKTWRGYDQKSDRVILGTEYTNGESSIMFRTRDLIDFDYTARFIYNNLENGLEGLKNQKHKGTNPSDPNDHVEFYTPPEKAEFNGQLASEVSEDGNRGWRYVILYDRKGYRTFSTGGIIKDITGKQMLEQLAASLNIESRIKVIEEELDMDFGQYEIQDGTKKIETMMDGPDMYIIFSNSKE